MRPRCIYAAPVASLLHHGAKCFDDGGDVLLACGQCLVRLDVEVYRELKLFPGNSYEEIAKTELKYGLVVSGNPTNAPITGFDDEGKIVLAPSTVSVSMTNTDFTKFSIKVTGLPNAQNLNCCAYVVNAEKITYLGHNTTSDKAEIINHAGVIELTK